MNSYPRLYLWLVAHRRAVLLTVVLLAAICVAISSRNLAATRPDR
jgi:hypothetical protein